MLRNELRLVLEDMEWCSAMRSDNEKIKEYLINNKEYLDEKIIPFKKAFNNLMDELFVDEKELKRVTIEDAKFSIAGDVAQATSSSIETVMVVLDGLEDEVFFDW